MDSRILGAIGGVLVLIGIFVPVVSLTVAGESTSISFFDGLKGGSWEAYVVLLCGIASIALALLKKYRILLATGLISLAVIVLNLINLKSSMAKAAGQTDAAALEAMGVGLSTQWLGWGILIVGSLLIVAAGATNRGASGAGSN